MHCISIGWRKEEAKHRTSIFHPTARVQHHNSVLLNSLLQVPNLSSSTPSLMNLTLSASDSEEKRNHHAPKHCVVSTAERVYIAIRSWVAPSGGCARMYSAR